MKKTDDRLRKMVFMAMYCALAIALDYVKRLIPFASIWANGGSIDISLIPLVIASFHLGVKFGVFTCAIEQVLAFLLGLTKFYVATANPIIGVLGDYVVPCLIIGFVTMFYNRKKVFDGKNLIRMELGIAICMIIRIAAQIVSGVYGWAGVQAASSWGSWLYSIQYNCSFGIPTLITLLIVVPAIYKVFDKKLMK